MARHLPLNPLSILFFYSWGAVFNRFTLRDMIVNVVLYLPFGMAGFLAFRGRLRYWGPVIGGFVLSSSIEMIQLFEPTRNTSAIDVTTNVIGTILGVAAGAVFERIAGPIDRTAARGRRVDRAALSLTFLWAAYLVFPLFPLVGFFGPRRKLQIFLHSPVFTPMAVISAAAVWFAAGILLRAAGFRRATLWLALSILAIPLQFFIVDRQPVPSDLIGAAVGILLALAVGRNSRLRLIEAVAFLAVIALRGLAPFHWRQFAQGFTWIPFGGLLYSPWQLALHTLIEKGFYYGAAIWLFASSRMRMPLATALVAAALLGIEVAQLWLPGRTAEITDPVLAILLGIGMASLSRETGTRSLSAG